MMKSILLFSSFFIFSFFAQAQWTEVTPPPDNFRSDHTFGFAFGNVGYLVTGNVDFEPTASFYSYSADIDSWTQLSDFPGGTRGYAIGDVLGDKAYFGFGRGDSPTSGIGDKNDLWEFDSASGEWTELASCPCSPRIHPAFVALDGNIFVGLGSGDSGNLDDWWVYNIATDSWSQKTDFPSFERHHPFQFGIGEYVYVGFGHGDEGVGIYRTWYKYDLSSDNWTQVSDIPAEGRVAGTQFSHGGFGYVLSGDGSDHSSMPSGEFWKYDGDTDSWEELEPHPGQSRWAPASFVINNEVYLFNGSVSFTNYPDESYKFNLGEATGIEESESNEDLIHVYPNPFVDEFWFNMRNGLISEFSEVNFRVLNILGEVVFESRIISNSHKISLENIADGIYVLEVFVDEIKVASEKIYKAE